MHAAPHSSSAARSRSAPAPRCSMPRSIASTVSTAGGVRRNLLGLCRVLPRPEQPGARHSGHPREYPQYSKAELGSALTGLSIAYGISKFLMGSVSDRSNPRYFLPLGLLLSCVIMAGDRAREGRLQLACRPHRAADAERLGARHGLAALRQDDGALVQHQGARARRLVLERVTQRRRRARREPGARRGAPVRRLGREVLLQRWRVRPSWP